LPFEVISVSELIAAPGLINLSVDR